MYKTITKITTEQKSRLISDFLKKLGRRLVAKRLDQGLKQGELAECLGIDHSTLSNYEHGKSDMNVSMLPLFSTYCKFPMYELFPKEESQAILDTLAKSVSITVDRKKRQEERRRKKEDKPKDQKKPKKILKGQVYDIDGQEVFEPVQRKEGKSLREQYKDAEVDIVDQPFTEAEFQNFVIEQKEDLVESMVSAGQFLRQIEKMPNKETLKCMIADYIVDELIIESVSQDRQDSAARRAYAYYRKLYLEYLHGKDDPDSNEP